MDLGFDSILAVQIQKALSAETGLQLPATLLFKYASVDQLTDYLLAEHDALLAQRRWISLGFASRRSNR